MPEVGQAVTVELPGERTRADVLRVISPDLMVVEINQFTTQAKTHPYKKGDTLGVRRSRDALGQPAWVAVPEAELGAAPESEPESVPMREMIEGDL